ncbi:MAG: CvpA family protein [Aquincola sp.]|uniref:CvpA family protein n=1 Tax=uncultured Aquincola sp. TaxID=886556 RepID=UPI0032B1D110|nr:CvpA family protein [Aquincola sp.]|tara:strand:+ start:59 stop:1015 length:957 start_codon:yes stop_codon:yes gene_type:complete
MTLADAVLVIVVLFSLFAGWQRGFLLATVELVCLVAAVLLAFVAYPTVADELVRWQAELGVWAAPLSFLGVYVLGRILMGAVARAGLRRLPERAHGHGINRALGVLPGAANGLINATIVAMLLLVMPFSDRVSTAMRDSRLAERLAAPAEWVEAQLGPIFDPAVQQTLHKLTVRPGSRETVKLPFAVSQPRPRPDLEAQMLVLVNEERGRQGLKPLVADPAAAEVAREHSRDMFERSYFSHITPDGLDPFDRMRAGHLRYLAAGENLALARTLAMAHRGLMESPGHRANILRPAFGRVGIGILDGGRHGLMVTQNFRN